MNIRDVVVQEQERAGREAGRTANIYAGQKAQKQGAVSALGDIVAVNGNMEVPVATKTKMDGENSGNYSFADMAAAAQDMAANAAEGVAANEQAGQNLSILTGENYSRIEEEEGSLEEYQESSLDRAVERIRSEREWKEERLEEGMELRRDLQEGLENIQTLGFLSEKGEAQIREALERADLPVTQDLVNQVAAALQMSTSVAELSDSAKSFMIAQNLPATIENLYHAQHSGMAANTAEAIPKDVWEQYGPKIEQILQEIGGESQKLLPQAQWLFANELPIDADTLQVLQDLEELSESVLLDHTLNQIITQLAGGGRAFDTNLLQSDQDYQEYQDAAFFVERVSGIGEPDIYKTLQKMQEDAAAGGDGQGQDARQGQNPQPELTLEKLLEAAEDTDDVTDASQFDIQSITVRRQLEEIRLLMTANSVLELRRQGITIETEPLENTIEQLRALEDAYYIKQAEDAGLTLTEEELAGMHELTWQTADIAAAPAALLGSSVKQHQLLTVHELHGMAVSMTKQYQQYQQDYEAVGTQVRQDLGDSIKKAFAGIPEMLQDLGLEHTEANARAVRILGYNQMEITPESIQSVKEWDAEVNDLIRQAKPSLVLEMIREGKDPLNMSIPELNRYLHEKQQENGVAEEEKYSRYLWQLERQDGINAEERKDYIAIYRLLHQIEQSDGAVVGAVLQAGQHMDLKHLQTAARTMRVGALDETVSDETGVHVASEDYYQRMAEDILDHITPAKLRELANGDLPQIMDRSLEQISEKLREVEGDPQLLEEYYERQAEGLRETVRLADQARTFLNQFEVPGTIGNLRAAEFMLQEGGSPVKELLDRRRILEEDARKELEDILEELSESIDSREELEEQCRQTERFMQQILSKSKESADINSEDLKYLKLLGQGLRLQESLTRHQNYEIPILTGDTVTMINLTILQGKEQSGRIQINMESVDFGRVSGEMQIQGEQIKGLILCDDRVGFDALKEQGMTLAEKLEGSGFSVKKISYGMDYKSRGEVYGQQTSEADVDTKSLYRIAKVLVHHISETVRQTTRQGGEEVNYED